MKKFVLFGLAAVFAATAFSSAYAQENAKKPPSYVKDPGAAWVILSKKPVKEGLELLEKGAEGDNAPATKGGKEAWASLGKNNAVPDNPDASPFMYFKITKKAFKKGAAPRVKLTVEYFDEGEAEVGLEYDSSDDAVAKCPIPGAFKDHAEKILLEDSGKWKTFSFEIEDAKFDDSCNGCDFRFNFPGGVTFTVGSAAVEKMK